MHDPSALTYVVLDVPDPQAAAVMAIRQTHRDLFRAALPVEITLTDCFQPEQDPSAAFDALDRIATDTAPIESSFTTGYRFPRSDTFVMRLKDDEPFRQVRDAIIGAGLRFQSSPYEYVPHCTLRTRSPVSEQEADELLATAIPGRMTLDTISVYTLRRAANEAGVSCELRHRARLGGIAG